MDSKERILESARKVFTAYGFAASSTTEIAKIADVSQGMIFHYFTNKETLWSEVIKSVSKVEELQSLTLPSFSLSYEMFLTEVIREVIHLYRSNPEIPRLLAWHRLEQPYSRAANIFFAESSLREAFFHYQATGDISGSMRVGYYLMFFMDIVISIGYSPNLVFYDGQDTEAYINFFVIQLKNAFR